MEGTLPTKFGDLDVKELRRSAIEDFAVEVGLNDNKKTVLAALLESGVTWDDYVAQHPEVAPKVEVSSNVVTTKTLEDQPAPYAPVEEEVVIKVREEPVPQANERYLIKMTRENPLYQTLGYKFTQEHPYALVKPEHLDYILEKEIGFRQATPSELREFYDRGK